MVASMEAPWLGGEFVRGGGNHCNFIGLIISWGEMLSYKTIIPPNPRGHRTLSVSVAEARKGGWAQFFEGSKINRDYK